MTIRVGRSCTLGLVGLFLLVGLAAQGGAQANTFIRLNRIERSRQRLAKTRRSNNPKAADSGPLTALYNFCSEANCADGANSTAGLIQDAAGNLYGTTSSGGVNTGANGGVGGGTVFMVNPSGQETVLYSFCSAANCTDGVIPAASLIEDSAGNLYGTTSAGGSGAPGIGGGGTVFELQPPAQEGGAWTETVLYSFCPQKGCADGENPVSGLIRDEAGNLYGTTFAGGVHGDGTVFEVTPAGTETVLYSFKQGNGDGNSPEAGLIRDAAGNFYGTTFLGGANGQGTVFELSTTGEETVLYSFCSTGGTNCTDGQNPVAGLIADSAGNFYSTTYGGGANGFGVVFELTSSGTETVLYNFCSVGGANCTDGAYPAAALLKGASGAFYSTTEGGGSGSLGCYLIGLSTCGTVFELAPGEQQSDAWSETVIYSFCLTGGTNCTDGASPEGGLVQDSAGNLYSTTSSGGANTTNGGGTVFRLATNTLLIPTVTAASSPNPSSAGQNVTLTATVSGSGATPTGTVTFEQGSTTLGTATLASGKASLQYAFPLAGSFSIVASYSGDAIYEGGLSSPLKQVVKLDTTTTSLASNLNPSLYGQPVTFTATINSSGTTPTGTVTFKSGTKAIGSASVSGGIAQLTLSTLVVGTSKITAVYSGDGANLGSTSPALKQVVAQTTSSTVVASSVNPSNPKQKVKFTATVTSPTTTPTGKVTFMDGSTVLGTGELNKGLVSYSTTTLSAGSHNITAVYAGTTDVSGSTSPILVQVVN